MYTYTVTFKGRKLDAIGITYPLTEVIESESRLTPIIIEYQLYDSYDHISSLKIREHRNKNKPAGEK